MNEGLSTKDAKKLNKASALYQSSDPKDQDRARAKKAGYKNPQDYANVVARYGSEDNYRKGKGLGTCPIPHQI